MKFKEHLFNEKLIGHSVIQDDVLFFFGNRHFQRKHFEAAFPELKFTEVKQVHGDNCVDTSASIVEADAHWTDQANTALLIKTADCMPLLLKQESRILAIHSGWRGTYANILLKAFNATFSSDKSLAIACGPFIQKQSFEIDLSLAKKFTEQFSEINDLYSISKTDPQKAYLDLKLVLRWQIQQLPEADVFISDVDTKTHVDYCSYRREPDANLRNYSFVARLN